MCIGMGEGRDAERGSVAGARSVYVGSSKWEVVHVGDSGVMIGETKRLCDVELSVDGYEPGSEGGEGTRKKTRRVHTILH